jgi:hypothetical protein
VVLMLVPMPAEPLLTFPLIYTIPPATKPKPTLPFLIWRV